MNEGDAGDSLGSMLEVISLETPSQRQQLFEGFDPQKQSWIVSDLKSKLSLQKRCLDRWGWLPDEAVMRASELWRRLLLKHDPSWRIISPELMQALIGEWLLESELEWARSPGAARQIFHFITQFSALLFHPEGFDRMGDWYRSHPESYLRWGEAYILATDLTKKISERRLIVPAWVPGVLVQSESLMKVFRRDIILDLGPDLQTTEAEISKTLAQAVKVSVVRPSEKVVTGFESLFSTYQAFQFAEKTRELSSRTKEPRFFARRFSTMLAEVKDTVAQIREWLEEGISPAEIAIVLPDLHTYWKVLEPYLDCEGIPFSLPRTTLLSDFPEIARWLSRLLIFSGEPSSEDLEQVLFSGESERMVTPDRFRVALSRIYGTEDLGREPKVEKWRLSQRAPSGAVLRDDFVQWALASVGPNESLERVETLLKLLVQESPMNLRLQSRHWIGVLREKASRKDVILEPSQLGIQVVDLDSAEDVMAERSLFLGLSDSALRPSQVSLVDNHELGSISQDLGFVLPRRDPARLEFKARWAFQNQKVIVASFSSTSFDGDALAPSLLWMDLADKEEGGVRQQSPRLTRWDELQRGAIGAVELERSWSEPQARLLRDQLECDLGRRDVLPIRTDHWRRLSASSLEKFYSCAFIFSAQRLFRLSDPTVLDLDLDPRSQGQMIHRILEELLKPPLRLEWSDLELQELVESCRIEEKLELGEKRFWTRTRERYIQLARRFLLAEKEWRRQLFKTQTLERELKFEMHFDPESGSFLKEGTGRTIVISGKIDRVDEDSQGRLAVLDYKSSAAGLRQFGSWVDNHLYQLGLYTLCIESGLTPVGERHVAGAFYYVLRGMDRSKGFAVTELGGELFPPKGRAKNHISEEEKKEHLQEIRARLKEFGRRAELGDFRPVPEDQKTCETCEWRRLCRAPHLN